MNETILIDGQSYSLTTEHPASSYGLVILVAGNGQPYGAGDTCRLRLERASDHAVSEMHRAGYDFDDCR